MTAEAPKPSRPRSERAIRRDALYGAPLPGEGMTEDELPVCEAWPEDARLRVGTSGWAYRHWLGRLYPRSLPSAKLLAHFACRFATVEVNSTYYQLPSVETFRAWRDATPPGFQLTVKAPGVITHEKRLVDADDDVRDFLARVKVLGEKLGVLLFQFPPGFHADVETRPRFERFLGGLPPGTRYAVELRHRSWWERDVKRLFEREGVAWVVHDFSQRGSPVWTTSPVAYLRLHGPTGRYRGSYPVETLLAWSEQVKAWLREGREVWCYLNNDERGNGVRNAMALRAFCESLSPKGRLATPCERSSAAGRRSA